MNKNVGIATGIGIAIIVGVIIFQIDQTMWQQVSSDEYYEKDGKERGRKGWLWGGSKIKSGLLASLSTPRTSMRSSRRGALNDAGCDPRSEARPWRPEISATALQIIAGEDTLVETRRSRGADVTCAETAACARTDGAAWLGQRRPGWEVVATEAVCRQKRGGDGSRGDQSARG